MDISADPETLHKKLLFCNIINIIISLVPGEMSKHAAHTCAQFMETVRETQSLFPGTDGALTCLVHMHGSVLRGLL